MSRKLGILFVALTVTILISAMVAFAAVGKLQRIAYWPFGGDESMFVQAAEISDDVLLFLASSLGKVVIWLAAVGIPVFCVFLWLKRDQVALALSILFCTATIFAWFGIRLYIHVMLDAVQIS
jgi:hypothetical protein